MSQMDISKGLPNKVFWWFVPGPLRSTATLAVARKVVQIAEENYRQDFIVTPGSYIRLRVADTGAGMEPQLLSRIFEPYFTTKAVGKGTGMGLAVMHGIVRSSGGAISVDRKPGKGTRFEVLLPRAIDEVSRMPEPDKAIPTDSEHILMVEDDQQVVIIMERMLASLGYRVTVETDSREALKTFSESPDRFDLVITDFSMPHITDDKLAIEILRTKPAMPIILCTGFTEKLSPEEAEKSGIREYLIKPLRRQQPAQRVREVLDTGAKTKFEN